MIDQAVFLKNARAALTTAFGALALLLACIGLVRNDVLCNRPPHAGDRNTYGIGS